MHRKDEDKSQDCRPYKVDSGSLFTIVELGNESRSKSIESECDNLLLFLLHGELFIDNDVVGKQRLKKKEFAFLQAPLSVKLDIKPFSCALILSYRDLLWMYNSETGVRPENEFNDKYCCNNLILSIKEPWALFLNQLVCYFNDGVSFCENLHDIKLRELSFIFNKYYSEEVVIKSFQQNISIALDFQTKVLNSYLEAKTVVDLADRCGYGLKSFQRMFKLYFGETPYKWMRKQMAVVIESKLRDTEIPIKQIVSDYGFSSVSHFNTYCKKYFHATPKQVRSRMKSELD